MLPMMQRKDFLKKKGAKKKIASIFHTSKDCRPLPKKAKVLQRFTPHKRK